MTGRFPRTRKAVSKSSKIFERMNARTKMPHIPWPYQAGSEQTVAFKPAENMLNQNKRKRKFVINFNIGETLPSLWVE